MSGGRGRREATRAASTRRRGARPSARRGAANRGAAIDVPVRTCGRPSCCVRREQAAVPGRAARAWRVCGKRPAAERGQRSSLWIPAARNQEPNGGSWWVRRRKGCPSTPEIDLNLACKNGL
jgi:hypothetical protein